MESMAYNGPYSNVTLPGGLKEDFITVPIVSWTIIALYSIWTLTLLILIIWRRNHQPIKARSPLLMILTLISMSLFALVMSLRFGVGRSIFPCILYTMAFSLMQPGVFLPTVLRAWRLFFMYRVSTKKQAVADRHFKQRKSVEMDARTEIADEEQVEMVEITMEMVETGMKMEETTVEMVDDHDNDSDDEEEEEEDTDVTKKKGHMPMTRKNSSKQTERMLKVMTISVSSPFLIGVFITSVVFHLLVWLGTSFIDPAIYFDFTQGCYFGRVQMILGIVLALGYIAMMFVLGVLLLTVKDTWFMRYEIYINIAQWLVIAVIYTTCGSIDWVDKFADYYFPYGFVPVFGCFFDNAICCVVPLLASFRMQRHSNAFKNKLLDQETGGEKQSELHFVLESKQLRGMFKKFTVQSFAPESLLCWEFIERYKTMKKGSRRFRFGKSLVENFMLPSGNLELNLPAQFKPEEYMNKLEENPSDPSMDLFASLQRHCEEDLVDLFVRFNTRSDYLRAKEKIAPGQ